MAGSSVRNRSEPVTVETPRGPVVEEARSLTLYWDGTTQDGVYETIPKPRCLSRTTNN